MTTKNLTMGELLKRAATPRGRRKPLHESLILHNRVVYLQHAMEQVNAAMADQPGMPEAWDEPTQQLAEMTRQLMSDEDVTFDEADVQQVYDLAQAALAELTVKARCSTDIENMRLPDLQWYHDPKPPAPGSFEEALANREDVQPATHDGVVESTLDEMDALQQDINERQRAALEAGDVEVTEEMAQAFETLREYGLADPDATDEERFGGSTKPDTATVSQEDVDELTDSGMTMAQAFETLREAGLADPDATDEELQAELDAEKARVAAEKAADDAEYEAGNYDIPAEVEQVETPASFDPAEKVGPAVDEPPVEVDPDWRDAYVDFDNVEKIVLAGVEYRRDPLSAAYPNLPDEQLEMLAENLRQDGQRLPVSLYLPTGTILDGWQRLLALFRIRRAPIVRELDVDDLGEGLAAYVMAINEHRRGSESQNGTQRALQAIRLDDTDRSRGETKRRPASAKKLAAAAGVSTTTVEQVRRARRWDSAHDTNLEEQMRRGRLSAQAAADRVAELEREAEQGETPPAPAPAQPEPPRRSRSDLEDLLRGQEEQNEIDKLEAEKRVEAERLKAEAAASDAAKTRAQLQTLADRDETAKQVLSLEEQRDALQSQVDVLTERLATAEATRDRYKARLDRAIAALHDDDRDELYDALGVEPPVEPLDEDDPFA